MSEDLRRKKRVRAGHKASATRMMTRARGILDEEGGPDLEELRLVLMSLREKLEVIKALDNDVLTLTGEDDLAEEIEQADEYKESIYAVIVKIEKATAPAATVSRPPERREPPLPPGLGTAAKNRVRLPKLIIKPFNGSLTSWTTFWDTYKSTIHDNSELTMIEKFTYLRSLLTSSALESLSGLTLTSANYTEAVEILTRRFGNKQRIINEHMDNLLRASPVASPYDVKGLRRLYDIVESNVRSLRSLEVATEMYGAMLASVLMSKLPTELRLIANRKIGEDELELEKLMEIVETELKARERSALTTSDPKKPVAKKDTEQPTAASLLTRESTTLSCCFCTNDHPSKDCMTIPDVKDRMSILRKTGRCYVCLRRNHIARHCRTKLKCHNCQGRHHVAVCSGESARSSTAATTSTKATPSASNSTTDLNPKASAYEPGAPVNPNLWTYSNRDVLLQTARTVAFNPSNQASHRAVRIVLDTGSQLSYVTNQVKTELSLETSGEQNMSIATFGSERSEQRSCERVRLGLKTRDRQDKFLNLYSVPTICEPLTTQSLSLVVYRELHPHVLQLDLADKPEIEKTQLEVDILITTGRFLLVASSGSQMDQ